MLYNKVTKGNICNSSWKRSSERCGT